MAVSRNCQSYGYSRSRRYLLPSGVSIVTGDFCPPRSRSLSNRDLSILYFHWPTFSVDIASRRYTHDRAFFAVTMAVCATARARVQDGALPPPWLRTIESASVPTADAFHQACLDSLPTAVTGQVEFNWMRTESLLCTLCLQNNDLRGCHAHMHRYLAMCADTGFHDERRWPRHLSEIEIQERRRLVSFKLTLPKEAENNGGSSIVLATVSF
jgi:hypothetical protein